VNEITRGAAARDCCYIINAFPRLNLFAKIKYAQTRKIIRLRFRVPEYRRSSSSASQTHYVLFFTAIDREGVTISKKEDESNLHGNHNDNDDNNDVAKDALECCKSPHFPFLCTTEQVHICFPAQSILKAMLLLRRMLTECCKFQHCLFFNESGMFAFSNIIHSDWCKCFLTLRIINKSRSMSVYRFFLRLHREKERIDNSILLLKR